MTEMEGPVTASFISDLVVLGDRVLLRELSVRESGRWFAFDRNGTPMGFLPLPSGAKLLDMTEDRLLVREAGPAGVPIAVLYAVSTHSR